MILCLFILLIFSTGVHALGVAPSRTVVDYTGQKEIIISGRVLNNEAKDMRVLIVPADDLAGSVTIPQNIISLTAGQGEAKFTYALVVPTNLRPGPNLLSMHFIALPAERQQEIIVVGGKLVTLDTEHDTAQISATSAIIQQVVIQVPYPGTYADGKLYVGASGINEPVTFTASLHNRGDTHISAQGYVLIKGATNEEIARLDIPGTVEIDSNGESKLVAQWDGTSNEGIYYAEFIVTYNGETLVLDQPFNIGNKYIAIEEINVKSFRLGAIAKLDVALLSKWNEPIMDVYSEMQILDKEGSVLDTFKTSEVTLPARGKGVVSGYWDTEGVQIGDYDVQVVVNYAGTTSQKLFDAVVSLDSITFKGQTLTGEVIGSPQSGGKLSLLIILVGVLIVLNIGLFIFIKRSWRGRPPQGGPQQPYASPPVSSPNIASASAPQQPGQRYGP
ncbi:MAG: hypothetical protein ABIH41_02945 [Nanoarchaeota archaeon]